MITRNFNLFLSAGHSIPLVINANQAEEGEQWVFSLFREDGTPYTPTDGSIVGIKSDGYLISNSGTVVDGKVVISETKQMTAAAGKAVFELRIDGLTHGTANFIVLVEEDPTNEGIVSDSDLSLIEEALSAVSPLPTGGSVGQVLTKTANGSAWSDAGTPTQEQVADAVSDWADEHITVETGVVIDTSLAVAGAAADSKKVGDELSDLKSAINDFTETIYSVNIFDQENTTITEGKYLNFNNGNEGTNASYCYVNEYMPIESDQTYVGSLWRKSDLSLAGPFNEMICFYDSAKAFISGVQVPTADAGVFTTPAGAAYYRFSCNINSYTNGWYMIEKGTVRSSQFVPYSVTHKLKLPVTIVDINGNGDFTSIADAVNVLSDGSAILVMPGTYEENVRAWSKEIHIIGIDREACILKDTSGNYSTPPLEIGAGSVQNMSIIEQAEGAGTANMGAYAIHVESNNLYNKKLLIRNCYIYSDSSSAIGMGLRGGCSVRIEDCEIICAGARESTGAAPLYFHDADAQAYWGTANLYLHGNVLRNTASSLFSMLTINSIHAENTTYMHMMYNIFVRSKTPSASQKYNTWNKSGNTDADGWNGLSHMYLEDDSFGNNQTELNYSA